MNCGRDENPTYHTSIHLDVNISFKTLRTTWVNLILGAIITYCVGSLRLLRHTEFTTLDPWYSKKIAM